ncbi:ABC transporter ATP-binding protein [Leptolyngbya sp. NIES-2104]|uniref:ABC transporter ATP-binding protein n=1 Tax=Leptolyngbya sp. NIES-2104 TaxID=1552121 RepID=UPI0006ECA53E|nr:ABC transporter ATP-binding protein [Leptolyngbya sp. NIES-2104]GAP97609.1 ABC transporter ATP binding subunit [Leptolyngbya sp. NIES-2104]
MRTLEPKTAQAPLSESEVILSVDDVSKKFCRDLKRSLIYGVKDIVSELSGTRQGTDTLRHKEFWALNKVSFQLKRGEAVGLIGKNGSGKSTLLRIISGLIKPDAGSIEVVGRVAPLIALGAGFSPILSGRENIYANMSILGVSKREIRNLIDEVIDFAEIGNAIDAPVQTYSSGMAARLGFACAIHTKPDILLLDEVLAVGDLKFRQKCYRMLNQLRQDGTAFVLVAHNSNAILSVCDTAVYLKQGQVVTTGRADDVVTRYERDLFSIEVQESAGRLFLSSKKPGESTGLDILSLCFKDESGEMTDAPISGKPTDFCIAYRAEEPLQDASIDLMIKDQIGEGEWMLRLTSEKDQPNLTLPPGDHEVRVRLPYCGLKPGVYLMKVIIRQDRLHCLDGVESFRFAVAGSENMTSCMFYQPREWHVF